MTDRADEIARELRHMAIDDCAEAALASIREACAKSRMMHSQGLRRMREHAERQLRHS